MEDEVVIVEKFIINNNHINDIFSFFAICDGHGGNAAAIYMKDNLLNFLLNAFNDSKTIEETLTKTYISIDAAFLSQTKDVSGTTCCSALISLTTGNIYVANVGDSRALFFSDVVAVTQLSMDHKATRADEVARIRAAGGFIINKRVMGELAITRALGDAKFKDPDYVLVTAEPEIMQCVGSGTLVIACDGLYDVMSNEEIEKFVKESQGTVEERTKLLANNALIKKSLDNVSCILVEIISDVPSNPLVQSIELDIINNDDNMIDENVSITVMN